MSIREALERGPLERPHTVDSFGDNSEKYAVLAKADLLLQQAQIPEALIELIEIIRPSFPDVKVSEKLLSANGTVNMGIEWNFRPRLGGQEGEYEYTNLPISVWADKRRNSDRQ